jgi:hypothetical protein
MYCQWMDFMKFYSFNLFSALQASFLTFFQNIDYQHFKKYINKNFAKNDKKMSFCGNLWENRLRLCL